ncbi:MAG: TorD/DmsD family molecular chaperone [Syntrophales bacterium]
MEQLMSNPGAGGWLSPYIAIRADCYVILASLLGQAPSEALIATLQNLRWDETVPGKLAWGLDGLRREARLSTHTAIAAEFNRLFVGMGCGEMVPYASWYRERKIQSSPLASLRGDLMRVGIVRRPDSCESEDHAGALCEAMALLSRETTGIPLAVQADFFRKHVASWLMSFFRDLRLAKSAEFYRTVAVFGENFLESESEYLNVDVTIRMTIPKGGLQNEKRNHRQPANIH